MTTICILGDAHLLYQAEWVDDERLLRDEAEEVLENFQKAVDKISKESPEAVILAGDMFDYRTQTGQRVAHREAEKYMVTVRGILIRLADQGCRIFALRGNHDSEPVLKSLQESLKGKFVYPGTRVLTIGELAVAFMDTHYLTGPYDIPIQEIPEKADALIMHESVPLPNIQGPPRETIVSICKRFGTVFNGHMHYYLEKALGIPNFYLLPAVIPSRRIKENWMIKYRYENGEVTQSKQESPFGHILYDGKKTQLKKFEPKQVIVRLEVIGNTPSDFLQGVDRLYSQLMERKEKESLRVWVKTNADRITVERVIKKEALKYTDIRTIEVEPEKVDILRAPSPLIEKEFRDVAFSRDELIDKVAETLDGIDLEIARMIFDEVLTPQLVLSRNPDEPAAFKRLLEIASKRYKVSDAFLQRAWDLAKEE